MKFKIFSNENFMAYNVKYQTDARYEYNLGSKNIDFNFRCLQMDYLDDLVTKWEAMR